MFKTSKLLLFFIPLFMKLFCLSLFFLLHLHTHKKLVFGPIDLSKNCLLTAINLLLIGQCKQFVAGKNALDVDLTEMRNKFTLLLLNFFFSFGYSLICIENCTFEIALLCCDRENLTFAVQPHKLNKNAHTIILIFFYFDDRYYRIRECSVLKHI